MMRAVRIILTEIGTRKNLKPSWQADLDFMMNYFTKKMVHEAPVPLITHTRALSDQRL